MIFYFLHLSINTLSLSINTSLYKYVKSLYKYVKYDEDLKLCGYERDGNIINNPAEIPRAYKVLFLYWFVLFIGLFSLLVCSAS